MTEPFCMTRSCLNPVAALDFIGEAANDRYAIAMEAEGGLPRYGGDSSFLAGSNTCRCQY